jgi:hypothetical protein
MPARAIGCMPKAYKEYNIAKRRNQHNSVYVEMHSESQNPEAQKVSNDVKMYKTWLG